MENIEQQKVARMRTVKQCLEEIKKTDPQTAVTEHYIRCLCKDSRVKHFLSGNKVLIKFDCLLKFINFEVTEEENGGLI